MHRIDCDILIVGGGVGGTAAALSASSYGLKVLLTEEYAWIGGQLTSQGVPPDEHPWIERTGCTAAYRDFRNRIRAFYQAYYPLRSDLRGSQFNPGAGFVSGLCHEPRIAHTVLQDMLAGGLADGSLTIMAGLVPVSAETDDDRIVLVALKNKHTDAAYVVTAKYVIDCTELGDLLPLVGAEYVSGAESHDDTNELHAADTANPDDVQGLTWCFAAGYDPLGEHIIKRPERYEFWRSYRPDLIDSPWPGNLIDWTAVSPVTLDPRKFDLFAQPDHPYNSLWNYRKIVSPEQLSIAADEVTLVNWPQNDYFLQNIIDQPEQTVIDALEDAKQLSLSLFYWMQTEAPRPDGGVGYPGLYLAPSVLGTPDGFAMAPYIRESRRIKALFTVTEGHVGTEMRTESGFKAAEQFVDSVGVGCYRIDLHPTPTHRNYIDISSLPFQIPLGALLPIRLRNLIAGNKNIGVTHITNGCYRLHPVEWNIGESAGHLAAYCIIEHREPREIHSNEILLTDFQNRLVDRGIQLSWPEEIAVIPR